MFRRVSSSTSNTVRSVYQTQSSRSLSVSVPRLNEPEILEQDNTNVKTFVLNRPKALNALNLPQVRELTQKYQLWDKNPAANIIVLKATGEKAFCAGGDIRSIYDSVKGENGGDKLSEEFFFEEYKLNHLIGTLSTPHVALINGITMGGGVGLSVHGTFRVATENTLFAMPETAIGLFPDVGGSFFLPRLQGELGMFLALTGHRLRSSDCKHAGIATHFVPAARIPHLEQRFSELTDGNLEAIEYAISEMEDFQHPFSLEDKMDLINGAFSQDSVEAIIDHLKTEGSEFAVKTAESMTKMSPMSMKVTFKQIRDGKRMSFAECFTMEYRLCQRFMEDNDFFEGVRALLVDKDNSPVWKPSSLEEVTDDMVNAYFEPLGNRDLFVEKK